MAAAHGNPVPTATDFPSSSSRAALHIINSIALYDIGTFLNSRRRNGGRALF